MSNDTVIEVKGVSKNFKLPHEKNSTIKSSVLNYFKHRKHGVETQHALHDISFSVKKGEFFGIVGRNGSGKSTLLKILAGIYQPSSGSVHITGKLVPFIELGVGFNGELTGRENVYLNGALLGFSRKEINDMYDDIVGFAELEAFMDQRLKNYSSGMQVRLAFSLATRAKADVLLIDEVLAVGDADFQRKCFEYFRSLKRTNTTVIFVSHDMGAVREYCDNAVLIENSEIVAAGTAEDIASKYIRMFIKQEEDAPSSFNTGQRWGDGSVKYSAAEVKVVPGPDYGQVVINVTAQAQKDVPHPIFGFTIKSSSGQSILGTNSRILKTKQRSLKQGESIELTWTMPNTLRDGKHVLDVAVVGEDGVDVYDWWEEAQEFTIAKEEVTPYLTNPYITVAETGKKSA